MALVPHVPKLPTLERWSLVSVMGINQRNLTLQDLWNKFKMPSILPLILTNSKLTNGASTLSCYSKIYLNWTFIFSDVGLYLNKSDLYFLWWNYTAEACVAYLTVCWITYDTLICLKYNCSNRLCNVSTVKFKKKHEFTNRIVLRIGK